MRTISSIGSERDLHDVLSVANTRHGVEAIRPLPPTARVAAREGYDRLRSPSEVARFLAALGVPVPAGVPSVEQILRLKLIRESVRALAEGDEVGYQRRLDRLASGIAFRLDGRELKPAGAGWDALIGGLVLPLAELRGHAQRLKVCGNNSCGWVFLDGTRNSGMIWCDAQLCGDRMRSRRYRRRHLAVTSAPR